MSPATLNNRDEKSLQDLLVFEDRDLLSRVRWYCYKKEEFMNNISVLWRVLNCSSVV